MTRDDLREFRLPDEPGIYKFLDAEGVILYIGKAASLRDRVRSYFSNDLSESRSPAIAAMVERANSLAWETTESVLEALILEANLIKKHQPPYNTDEKDNKSFNYLIITKENYPRLLIVRGRELFQSWKHEDIKKLFGPFPHGGALKEALKLVRKIFPFRDTCTPEVGKPCFNCQIGLCPGVCAGTMSKTEYSKTVKNISELFSGNMQSLRRRLEKEMKIAAKKEDFERAETVRRQAHALAHIRDVSLIKDEFRVASGGAFRIEAFDVAHTSGSQTVGVMVAVLGGEALKGEYRKFKIKSVSNDDTGALKELLERRLSHPEWQLPKLIVIDGGKGQQRVAARVLEEAGVRIPIIGVVKNEFHKPERMDGDERLIRAYEKDILLANNEAHRFAISWHRQRRTRSLRT